MGTADVRSGRQHIVHLIDKAPADENPNLGFLMKDLAQSIVRWRGEGRSVFIHCVGAQSRTPTVGAAYVCERFALSAEEALEEIGRLLPRMSPNAAFIDVLHRLWS
jgi:ADP-ribosyl-[dinitrogen reductase] hydrolase